MPPNMTEHESDRRKADVAFHELPVGTDLGSIEYELSEELVRRHLQATGQTPYQPSEHEQFAPVSVLASDGIRLAEVRFDIGESVHAGQRLEVVNLPVVGSWVTVRARVSDKFEKGGRQFVVMELTSEDDRGRLLARGVMTGVARYRPSEQP
jgi:hypothetical protein